MYFFLILSLTFVASVLFITGVFTKNKNKILDIRAEDNLRAINAKENTVIGKAIDGVSAGLKKIISRLHWRVLADVRDKIKKRLAMADMADEHPDYVIAGNLLYALIFCVLGFFVSFIFFDSIKLGMPILFFISGFSLSFYKIEEKIKKRHKNIFRSLPDVLDILTVSVEAGLDFNAALIRLIELEGKQNPLIKEFFLMQQEMHMGRSRVESLNNMSERVNEPNLSVVCSSLVQAMKMGTSVGPVLRLQAEQIRNQRFQKAEKLANEAPIKMLFPLIFLILPTVFLVLFVPLILTYLSSGIDF